MPSIVSAPLERRNAATTVAIQLQKSAVVEPAYRASAHALTMAIAMTPTPAARTPAMLASANTSASPIAVLAKEIIPLATTAMPALMGTIVSMECAQRLPREIANGVTATPEPGCAQSPVHQHLTAMIIIAAPRIPAKEIHYTVAMYP